MEPALNDMNRLNQELLSYIAELGCSSSNHTVFRQSKNLATSTSIPQNSALAAHALNNRFKLAYIPLSVVSLVYSYLSVAPDDSKTG